MSYKNGKLKYYLISLTDVENLLNISKDVREDFQEDISENSRAKEELSQFTSLLHAKFHEEIMYIGEEVIHGKHVERFLFNHGGFMEIILEKPLVLKAHFLHKSKADRFNYALKHTLEKLIPDHPIKDMFIDSITVEESVKNPLTVEKWMTMHNIYLKKSVIFTTIAIMIVILFEAIKGVVSYLSTALFNISHPFTITVVGAVVIAFMFEPIKKRTEAIVNKYFIK